MAVTDPVRYDLVLLHGADPNKHGLFVVDQIAAPDVYLYPVEDRQVVSSSTTKDRRLHVQTSEIAAVISSGGNNRG